MLRKWIAGTVVAALIWTPFAQAAGVPETDRTASVKVASADYEEQVQEIRQEFASERLRLGLSTAAGASASPESNLGQPDCQDGAGGGTSGGAGGSVPAAASGTCSPGTCAGCSKGAPTWRVNMVNLNFYMTDTPLWYKPSIGPPVELTLSYNGSTSIDPASPVGNKWQLNYGSYVKPYLATDSAAVVMPDGRNDLYLSDSAGGYHHPYRVFNKLSKLGGNRYRLDFPDGMVYIYDVPSGTTSSFPLLVEIWDAHAQKLLLHYDSKGRLKTVTDAQGKVTTFTYSSISGLLKSVTDPFGRFAVFSYDAKGNLIKMTDMGGYSTSFGYDSNSYPILLTTGTGTWSFTFEPPDGIANGSNPYPAPGASMGYNSRITVTGPLGGKEEFYYQRLNPKGNDSSSWYVSAKNYVPYANSSTNNYKTAQKTAYSIVSTKKTGSGSMGKVGSIVSPEGEEVSFGYGGTDYNLTSFSNHFSNRSYVYNSMGRLTSITDSTTTSLTYAANGVDLKNITNGLGTIAFTYNTTHDVTSVTDRLGGKTTFSYNAYGQKTSRTDPLGVKTTYSYDASHRLVAVKRAGLMLRSNTYDTVGRIKTSTDAAGITLTYGYNGLDEPTKITYPDGKSVAIAYSGAVPHRVLSVTEKSGLKTLFAYNAAGQLTKMTNPEGGVTTFKYDSNGNRAQLIDAKGHATNFEYDNDNRLLEKTFADGKSNSFTYDTAGRVKTYTNARQASNPYFPTKTAEYSYDNWDNLGEVVYYDITPYYTHWVNYGVDSYNRRTSMWDSSGQTFYTYDANSQLIGIKGPGVKDDLSFQYDAKGRLLSYTPEAGGAVSYTYDALNRVKTVKSSAGIFSYTYAGANPLPKQLTRPNGSTTSYQYDGLGRLTAVANRKSTGSLINQYTYTYNDRDLRSAETVTNGPAIPLVKGSTAYSYNKTNELLRTTGPTRTYQYDDDGNLTGCFTPAGNPLSGVYDAENRLAKFQYPDTTGTHKIEYTYKGDGMLAQKKDSLDKSVTTYLGYGPYRLQERDKNNSITSEYTWGANSGAGIGGLLSLRQGGKNYFPLYDGKGNVTAIIDSSQAIVATYGYDPFGILLKKTGSLDQPYQFSTKPYESGSGLSYFGYRFYSASLGRWMTRDPLGEEEGLNLYEYVLNNPVSYLDPDGKEPVTVGTIIFIVGVSIVIAVIVGGITYLIYKYGIEPNLQPEAGPNCQPDAGLAGYKKRLEDKFGPQKKPPILETTYELE